MLYRYFLILSLFFSNSFCEGIFDFWSNNNESITEHPDRRNIDINTDHVNQTFKIKRDDYLIEFIPSIIYGYSRLNIENESSILKTKTIDNKVGLGFSLNTSFNYFGNTKFGYMLNFNYESYTFDEDDITGSSQTNIDGNIIKIAPMIFYSFDINNISIYPSIGFGISKLDLRGTNNFNESITINDFSTLSTYKLELLYERYIISILQENISVDKIELNEIHISLGYLFSF